MWTCTALMLKISYITHTCISASLPPTREQLLQDLRDYVYKMSHINNTRIYKLLVYRDSDLCIRFQTITVDILQLPSHTTGYECWSFHTDVTDFHTLTDFSQSFLSNNLFLLSSSTAIACLAYKGIVHPKWKQSVIIY